MTMHYLPTAARTIAGELTGSTGIEWALWPGVDPAVYALSLEGDEGETLTVTHGAAEQAGGLAALLPLLIAMIDGEEIDGVIRQSEVVCEDAGVGGDLWEMTTELPGIALTQMCWIASGDAATRDAIRAQFPPIKLAA